MRALRGFVVLLIAIVAISIVGYQKAEAQSGDSISYYMPLAPCVNGDVPELDFAGNEDVPAYTGCDYTSAGLLVPADEDCPVGGMVLDPWGEGCIFETESLNDGWHDEFGNITPAPDGSCPKGYFLLPTPYNGYDHDICSDEPESDGKDSGSTDPGYGGAWPPNGFTAFTNGVPTTNCRLEPVDGELATDSLPYRTLVALTDNVVVGSDGHSWQMIIFEDDTPNCFIRADFLQSDDPGPLTAEATPEPPVDEIYQDPPDAVIDTPATYQPVTEASSDYQTVNVTTFPNTGSGDAVGDESGNIKLIGLLMLALLIGAFGFRVWVHNKYSDSEESEF